MKGLLAGVIAIVILALVLPRPDDDQAPQVRATPAKPPQAAAIASSGSLSHTNSGDGMPIFTALNVGPGTIVEGTVTMANTARSSGYFSLSQADLVDVPGPKGGTLSERLRLKVEDVTRPSAPVMVYEGPFAGMDLRPLGFIGPGSTRDYRFTASIPDGDTPSSPLDGDNAYKASSARARYVWTAMEGAPGPSAAPLPDRRPPRLRVSIPRVQRLFTRTYLVARVRCSEACRFRVTGRMRAGSSRVMATRPLRRRLAAGRKVQLRIRIPRPALRAMRRRLLGGRRVALTLDFQARDRAGNRTVVKRTVRFKPQRR